VYISNTYRIYECIIFAVLSNTHFDIVIVGAGPAGCAAALALRNSGLTVALLDKSIFPRNKTCGDAIPGAAFKTLQQIMPEAIAQWQDVVAKKSITHSQVVTAKGNSIKVQWSSLAYNSTRVSWDNFLLELVKKNTETIVYEACNIKQINNTPSAITISTKQDVQFTASIIIGCDGAYSAVKKQLFTATIENMPAVAVRAYYTNINIAPNTNYFYSNNKIAQSYLWIFPVENNLYNVGFGIIPSAATQHIDVKKAFTDLLATDKNIQHLFAHNTALTKIEGFKLPLYKKQIAISTNRCMLCGDAAQLIDPIQGHGIDKAMESGRLAALQAIQCVAQNNFSAAFINKYDKQVYATIGKELQRNVKILKVLTKHAWLLDVAAKLSNIGFVNSWMKKLS
jgi:menaquinone-9 beta-reductase